MESKIANTLAEAEKIGAILAKEEVPVIIIGAIALAAHHYIRSTKDVDLGVNIDLKKLKRIHQILQDSGYHAELHLPDSADPLGGVIDVNGPFGLVQIVNFGDRFPAAIEDALRQGIGHESGITTLAIAPLPQLIALKLYAGGWKSLADVTELLRRNPDADLDAIGKICRDYRLPGWKQVLDDLQAG
jgi:hypothetical protein